MNGLFSFWGNIHRVLLPIGVLASALYYYRPEQFVSAFMRETILLPAATGCFCIGLLTWLTRPPTPGHRQKAGYRLALKLIAQAERYHGEKTFIPSVGYTVPMHELVPPEQLNALYDLLPACFLPNRHPGTSVQLDWYRWHLCVVAGSKDMRLASNIQHSLRNRQGALRIYLDESGYAEAASRVEDYRQRVFYAGSRFCLALISESVLEDGDRKDELQRAMQREELKPNGTLAIKGFSDVVRGYLLPVPLDGLGRKYMKEEPLLNEFVPLKEFEDEALRENAILNLVQMALIKDGVMQSPIRATPIQVKGSVTVFISHCEADKPFAEALAQRLKKKGVEVFFDQRSIAVGESIPAALDEGLRKADVFIIVLSTKTFESTWVNLELGATLMRRGVEGDKPIICPVLREKCQIPAILSPFKRVDFSDGADGFDELMRWMKNLHPDDPSD